MSMQHVTIDPQSVPPAVLQRAEAGRLGSWLMGSPLKRSIGCLTTSVVISIISTVLAGVIGMAVYNNDVGQYQENLSLYQYCQQSDVFCQPPSNPPDLISYLIPGLVLGVLTLILLVWFFRSWRNRPDRVDIFEEGMIWKHDGAYRTTTWRQIGQIARGSYHAADSESNTPEGISDLDVIGVLDKTDTPALLLSSSQQVAKSVRARLCDLVESEFVAHVLPATMQQYAAGTRLQFGPLSISQQGLSNGDDLLPWQQIERLEIGPARLVIRREGRTSDWFHDFWPNVPNACLFKAMVDEIRASKPR